MAHCKSSLSKSPRSKPTWMASRIIRVKGCYFMPLKAGSHMSSTLYMPPVLFYQRVTLFEDNVRSWRIVFSGQIRCFCSLKLPIYSISSFIHCQYLLILAAGFVYFKWSLAEGLGTPRRIRQSIRKARNENTHIHRENMQTRWRKTSGLDSNSSTMYNNRTITNIYNICCLVSVYMFVHCVRSHSKSVGYTLKIPLRTKGFLFYTIKSKIRRKAKMFFQVKPFSSFKQKKLIRTWHVWTLLHTHYKYRLPFLTQKHDCLP